LHGLKQLTGVERLVVMLLYGSGVRLEECLGLKISIWIVIRSSYGKERAKRTE
jgi:hypothetical protein